MAWRDFLEDTQENEEAGEEDSQTDMFEDRDHSDSRGSVEKTDHNECVILLKEILREQKLLIQKIDQLTKANDKFVIEGSSVERDYQCYLKEKFSSCPWVDDGELQRCFDSKKGLFRRSKECTGFWKDFQNFYQEVQGDKRGNKWERLYEKETKKIEAYLRSKWEQGQAQDLE